MTDDPDPQVEKARVVYFPAEAVDTIECAKTGQQIPAVIVARLGMSGWVHCPVCTADRHDRIWHRVDLLP
jgi:hypothetical protein